MTIDPSFHGSPDEVARRLKELKDEEVIDFIRDTVVRLDILATRLETLADKKEDQSNARTDSS